LAAVESIGDPADALAAWLDDVQRAAAQKLELTPAEGRTGGFWGGVLAWDDLTSVPGYRALAAALAVDPALHLAAGANVMLAVGIGATAWSLDRLLAGMAERARSLLATGESSAACARTLLAEARAFLNEPHEATFVATLRGIAVTQPLDLGSGFVLRRFDDTLQRLTGMRGGALPGAFQGPPPSIALTALRTVESRLGSPTDPGLFEVYPAALEQCRQQAEAIVRLLTLFTQNAVVMAGWTLQSGHWLALAMGAGQYHALERGAHLSEHPIAPDGEIELRAAVSWALACEGRPGNVHVGLQRFADATRRFSPSESIIDLMIAGEALFLTDTGPTEDRGELAFRLALRAAYYLSPDAGARRMVFNTLRRAYRARSRVVHGAAEAELRDGDLQETVRIMAVALRKAVGDLASGRVKGPGLADWNAVVLGG